MINFFSAYQKKDGTYEYGIKKIALNYLSGFFIIDLIATLPYQYMISTKNSENNLKSEASLLRITRLYRIVRLAKIIRIIKIA
jgi:hypothetical protein